MKFLAAPIMEKILSSIHWRMPVLWTTACSFGMIFQVQQKKQKGSVLLEVNLGNAVTSKGLAKPLDLLDDMMMATNNMRIHFVHTYLGFDTLCALKSPVCMNTTVLVHGTVDVCLQYHGFMHTGDFKLFRGMLDLFSPARVEYMVIREGIRNPSVPVCFLLSNLYSVAFYENKMVLVRLKDMGRILSKKKYFFASLFLLVGVVNL